MKRRLVFTSIVFNKFCRMRCPISSTDDEWWLYSIDNCDSPSKGIMNCIFPAEQPNNFPNEHYIFIYTFWFWFRSRHYVENVMRTVSICLHFAHLEFISFPISMQCNVFFTSFSFDNCDLFIWFSSHNAIQIRNPNRYVLVHSNKR